MKATNVLYYIVLAFLLYTRENEGARILAYFPMPSISHQVVFRPLTQELAKRGHELVIITPDPAYKKGENPDNIKEIDVHDISYKTWFDELVKGLGELLYDPAYNLRFVFKILIKVSDKQFNDKEVQELLTGNEKFDLILTEACSRPALVFSHIFKAPVIQISSLAAVKHNKQPLGIPSHPIYYPDQILKKINNLTVIDKLMNTYTDIQVQNVFNELIEQEDELIRQNLGESFPGVNELMENVDMLMLNINPMWDGNQAYPPNVVLLGGLHQKPEKPLPKDLKAYLDSSKKGVIYMSFGTNVNPSNLPPERIQIFNKVFSKLPYDVLWKWDKEDMPGKADNVKIFKWLPQSDLLRHPKMKLFITQAGLQSTDESITAGVPLIAFPMLADQWYNAEKYVYHKIGLHMDIHALNEEGLEVSIKKVIDDESYRQNVIRLRTLMNDQPQSPLERAVWWTEYVIRHKGAKHLKSPMANISWAEYIILDVLLLVLSVALVISLLGTFVFYKLVKLLGNFGSRKSKLKNN